MPDVPKRAARTARDAEALEAALGPLPQQSSSPALVLLTGLPGSGKSHLRRELQKRHPLAAMDSDALRRVLFQPAQHIKKEHTRLFPAMHVLAERLLSRAVSAVYDATNLQEAHRRPLYRIAERRSAGLIIVRVTAPDGVIRERLAVRARIADPLDASEATVEVYERMMAQEEAVQRPHIVVDTSRGLAGALDNILRELQAVEV